jgi:tetratricopeptide (TPR) repeat protein
MAAELSLIFPDASHVEVTLQQASGTSRSPANSFTAPLDQKTRQDLTWYLESYPVHYTTEIDDIRAAGVAGDLKKHGSALFDAAFASQAARRLFERFLESQETVRLLTVSSLDPAVLAQPWELLCDPDGTFLFLEDPSISIRRRPPDVGRQPYQPTPKDRLHLLFVVSRPDDAGLIDPRADPMAVMDALDKEAPGRVSFEFLRPPTLSALITRVNDKRLPPVDILHFDGHGAYDPDGRLSDAAHRSLAASGGAAMMRDTQAAGAHQGYLLFEDDSHKQALVPAALLGDLLQKKRVGLVILSACQSAMVSGEDALGSVAPRLIRAGIPSVLAMTQSVLVATTKELSKHFYHALAMGSPMGAALDAARTQLYANAKRGERRRAAGTMPLELCDWFVPALYQAGQDGALLTAAPGEPPAPPLPADNLPDRQESGFYGRKRELWDIERWFVQGTRCIVITGFGGQGKTTLALEAGRWLLRAGLFARVCFVTYSGFQGRDPVQTMLSTLATVMNANLIDVEAALAQLRTTPTLLILDNLESLEPAAGAELLTAAGRCSAQGPSRVLVTTRPEALAHPDYPTTGTKLCRYLPLDGLSPGDALDWFQSLWGLPPDPDVSIPKPEPVEELFAQVRFHPLSIGVLTQLLKRQRVADVAETLQAQLQRDNDPLLASLNLSLARLDKDAQAALPGLGVFTDGALDSLLVDVLELDAMRWAQLRDGLRQTGLVVLEAIPRIEGTFVRFHPTLAPAMRGRLTPVHLAQLSQRRRASYYQLSRELYTNDPRNPQMVRAVARRELPNLLASVFEAFEHRDADAADFADNVGRFLRTFGRTRDLAALHELAERATSVPGSDAWCLTRSNAGEHLFAQGKFAAAQSVFEEILRHFDEPSYRRATTLSWLARCHRARGQLERAETQLRQALGELKTLPAESGVRMTIHADLGDVLLDRGDLDGAELELTTSLKISEEVGDQRGVAVGNGQLGAIYLNRSDFSRAAQSFLDAIAAFERLHEPASIGMAYNNLGIVYRRAGNFDAAEQAYRRAAEIKERMGDRLSAAETWLNLAVAVHDQGRPAIDVEPWYRKALAVFDTENDRVMKARTLSNWASLLQSEPERLSEARDLARQGLAIDQTLDPGVSEIWKTYNILAKIADKQGDTAAASSYRAEARQSYAVAPIAKETLRRHRPLIGAMLVALHEPAARPALEEALSQRLTRGWGQLVAALRAILDGERDEDAMCASLDREDSLVIHSILRCLDDPEAAMEFLSPD